VYVKLTMRQQIGTERQSNERALTADLLAIAGRINMKLNII